MERKTFDHSIVNHSYSPLRVLLIYPSEKQAVRAMYIFQESNETWIGYKPPLGIMYIASYLKAYSSHEVKIIDAQSMQMTDEDVKKEIQRYKPDIVGITAWSDLWYCAWRIIQIVKEVDVNIHVTVGGPHVSIYPQVTLESSGCDSVIVGDGEIPFFWLVNGFSNGFIPDNLPGVHLKSSGIKSDKPLFYTHKDIDSLPFPDRIMLPLNLYTSVLSKEDYITTMITSRGCPYHCTYCKLNFQKTLSRSAQNVLEELEQISALGIKEVEIYDDTFSWSKKRVIEICKGIIERRIKLNWAIRDRVSNVSPDVMEWLANAGCKRIHYGIESGSDQILKNIKKGINTNQATEAIKLAKSFGIKVLAYFMLGMPGETIADFHQTMNFAKRLDPDYATFSITVPYPGTEMYLDGLKRNIIPEDFWLDFALHPTPGFFIPYFWEENFNKTQLLSLRNFAVRSFYFRPSYIVRQLLKVRSSGELWRKGFMAIGLFIATLSKLFRTEVKK